MTTIKVRNILLIAAADDSRYYARAKQCFQGHNVYTPKASFPYIHPYIKHCKTNGIDIIVLSHSHVLSGLIEELYGKTSPDNYSLQKWAGTILDYDGIKILVSRSFKQLLSVDYAPFLLKSYFRKLLLQEYYTPPPMDWSVISTQHQVDEAYKVLEGAETIAVDIETTKVPVDVAKYNAMHANSKPVAGLACYMKQNYGKPPLLAMPIIDMIGYTALLVGANGQLYSKTYVLNIRTMEDIRHMRRLNNTSPSKITQNGGYEASHLIRYNAPLNNWLGDTFHMGHCMYAELPRTLADLGAFWLGNFQYWKDEILSHRDLYNAKDTYNTLWIWVFQVRELKEYARNNYLIEFRKCFPFITCGLEGFKVDTEEQARLHKLYSKQQADSLTSLKTMIDPEFNPASPIQVAKLMQAFTKLKFTSTDNVALTKWGEISALNALITEKILNYRMASKKISTYLEATLFDDRMLYELNCGGTDTGRASSKGSNFWCGTNIQNQDNKLRSMYTADEGWLLANQDGSQAESRTTAYISEDATLIETVETAPDFHSRNASLFFGIPESEIINVTIVDGKQKVEVLLPKIRKLSKPVNHGSNYNMGASVLLQTMGTAKVLSAKKALKLKQSWSMIRVCEYLLETFIKTYPDIKGKYYDEVFEEICSTGRMVGATGWTRLFFSKPRRGGHKPTINKCVAHAPQSLSVMILDEACFDFWYEYQIVQNKVRLKAQVHDEVVYQCKEGDLYETQVALGKLVSRPYQVKGRTLIIPTDGGGHGYRWNELK